MKPRYTITITDHEKDEVETVKATSAVILSTERSTTDELKAAFEEMRLASPKLEIRVSSSSHIDVLFLEEVFMEHMKKLRKENPALQANVQEGVFRYIQSLQGKTSAPDAGGDRTESSSLVARLLDKEAK